MFMSGLQQTLITQAKVCVAIIMKTPTMILVSGTPRINLENTGGTSAMPHLLILTELL